MKIAVKLDNLEKSYGNNKVIKGISFYVNQGEIFALLGTNGAGKTTILECIEGLRQYNGGKITINGKIGVQLQSSSLPVNIKPLEAVRLFFKWSKAKYDKKLIETFQLEELSDKQYKQLSTGQKRRLHLALALIGDPDIVFLDEPTAGLDVESRMVLHDEIRKLKKRGKTIILASHDMAEVESLCDRIAILKDGKFAFIGTANDLTREMGQQAKIYIKTLDPFVTKNIEDCDYKGLEQGYNVYLVQNIGDILLELLVQIKTTGNTVVDIKVEKSTLEQRFIDIAKEKIL